MTDTVLTAESALRADSVSDGSRPGIWLGLILGSFLALRLPVMYLQPGGQDEDFYAVPGLTILQSGIPRLPHVPARNAESVFFRADDALFSEPPLYFYLQSLCYAVLPKVYGTARLASALAGITLLGLVYKLSRQSGASVTASLWAAGLLSVSRWFYFPATCARPDTLCCLLGFAAILSVLRWRQTGRFKPLALAGTWIGLGGLTHPFAIVYAVQIGLWVLIRSRGWGRLRNPAILTGVALLVFGLWLPLIAMYPEAFQIQFRNQFLSSSGTPIWQRALLPGESLYYHLVEMREHIGLIQFSIGAFGLIGSCVVPWRLRHPPLWEMSGLLWSSIYLLCVVVGPHHRVIGYWVYPAGLMFIFVGLALGQLIDFLSGGGGSPGDPPAPPASRQRLRIVRTTVTAAMLLLLLPGSGVRTLLVHLQHLRDVNYNSPRFADDLIETLPPDLVYAVDTQFALDFVAAGRRTLLAQTLPQYFRVDQFDFDVLVLSRHGEANQLARQLDASLIRTSGIQSDPWACYVEIYGESGLRKPLHRGPGSEPTRPR